MIPALLLVALFFALAVLHVYWALGGTRGKTLAVPEMDGKPLFQPGPGACLLVALLLLVAALLCLARVGWIPLPPFLASFGVWGLAAVFLARALGDFRYVGFFKSVRDTAFAVHDTRYYSPLCLLIAALAVWLSLSAP